MNPSSTQNAVDSSFARMSGEFISVGEALKLAPPFKGNKQEMLAFIWNVDTAFAVFNPEQEATLYKFVLTRISDEPSMAISHRNLDSWLELKQFLQNSYIEKSSNCLCTERSPKMSDIQRTKYSMYTMNPPDDEHNIARNM